MRRLSTHGITRDKKLMQFRSRNEIWNYQQIEIGFNYRMTDIQAALGLSQIKRLDRYVKLRHKIAKYYNSKLKELPVELVDISFAATAATVGLLCTGVALLHYRYRYVRCIR